VQTYTQISCWLAVSCWLAIVPEANLAQWQTNCTELHNDMFMQSAAAVVVSWLLLSARILILVVYYWQQVQSVPLYVRCRPVHTVNSRLRGVMQCANCLRIRQTDTGMIMGLGQHLFVEPAANTTVSPNFSKCSSDKSGSSSGSGSGSSNGSSNSSGSSSSRLRYVAARMVDSAVISSLAELTNAKKMRIPMQICRLLHGSGITFTQPQVCL